MSSGHATDHTDSDRPYRSAGAQAKASRRYSWVRSDRVLFLSPILVVRFIKDSNAEEELAMPIFMDTHENVDGLTAEAVAGAHARDLELQERHGVKYLKYWFNERTGRVYCLVEAPNAEAARAVHQEAHGLVADEVVEVHEGS